MNQVDQVTRTNKQSSSVSLNEILKLKVPSPMTVFLIISMCKPNFHEVNPGHISLNDSSFFQIESDLSNKGSIVICLLACHFQNQRLFNSGGVSATGAIKQRNPHRLMNYLSNRYFLSLNKTDKKSRYRFATSKKTCGPKSLGFFYKTINKMNNQYLRGLLNGNQSQRTINIFHTVSLLFLKQ